MPDSATRDLDHRGREEGNGGGRPRPQSRASHMQLALLGRSVVWARSREAANSSCCSRGGSPVPNLMRWCHAGGRAVRFPGGRGETAEVHVADARARSWGSCACARPPCFLECLPKVGATVYGAPVSHAVDLSITLDEEMLGRHGISVASPWTPDSLLPPCPDLARQVGDRFLLKYVRRDDRQRYSCFSGITHYSGVHYVTPTAICRQEVVAVLNLPAPLPAPAFALILDANLLEAQGPRRIRSGRGLEYVLPNGFPSKAIVAPGWPVTVK